MMTYIWNAFNKILINFTANFKLVWTIPLVKRVHNWLYEKVYFIYIFSTHILLKKLLCATKSEGIPLFGCCNYIFGIRSVHLFWIKLVTTYFELNLNWIVYYYFSLHIKNIWWYIILIINSLFKKIFSMSFLRSVSISNL